MSSIGAHCSVEDPCCGTEKGVRRHAAQAGGLGSHTHDALQRDRVADRVAPGDVPASTARLLSAHHEGVGVVTPRAVGSVRLEVAAEHRDELRTAHRAPGPPHLADAADLGRGVVEVDLAETEADHLRSGAGQPEPQDELVPQAELPHAPARAELLAERMLQVSQRAGCFAWSFS